MMEASSTSETSVNFYQTSRRNNSEDSRLHTRRRENLKSEMRNRLKSERYGTIQYRKFWLSVYFLEILIVRHIKL
jgi:hypothetical protein